MKNLKKQILSALIAISTLLSGGIQAFAAIPSDVQGTRYEEPVQILSALEIMVGDENGDFRLDDTIIRSEVAKMAIHALGLESVAESSKGETMFDDVSTEHWANGYINLAVSQGIIEGDGDGNFRPNAPITYAEAMTIMVRATGYTVPAEENGGYPNGYVKTASANGLTKNVQGKSSSEISRGNVAYLTTNALEAKLMEQTGFGANASYTVTDKTLLKDKLNVTKGTGQITAIAKASLSGKSNLADGQIKIGDTTYETSCQINDLLGYNVTYYLKSSKNKNDTIILAMPLSGKNKDLKITAELFSKLNEKNKTTYIEYFTNENTTKTTSAEISSDATLIYNGKYREMSTEYIDLSDKNGYMTLLDFNNDGEYDIVSVKCYENIVVNTVSSTGKISDKYSSTVLKLDDTVDYKITKGLEEIAIRDLKEYDVLSVYASLDKELYEIELTTKTISGKVSGKDSKGVLINGTKYKIASNYTEAVEIGTEGTFYLDIDGKIAGINAKGTASDGYAYLTRAYYTKNTDKATFVLFTKSGEEISLDGHSKIKFNGTSNVKASEVVNALTENGDTKAQLITYGVNSSNKVNSITTAVDNTDTGAVNENTFTKNLNLTEAKFSKSTSKLDNVRIDKNTIIFDISEGDDDYTAGGLDMLEDEQMYNASVYDMTENHTAKVLVITNSQSTPSGNAPLAVVKNISSAINSDDENTDMLTLLVNGKEESLLTKNADIIAKSVKALGEGDIIQYKTNSKDEITSVRLLLDASEKNTEFSANPYEKLETIYGKVTKKFTNSLNVTVNNGKTANYTTDENTIVYISDTSKSKNSITVGDFNDIHEFDSDENNRVFIKIYDDAVSEIVIVK